MQVTIEDLPGLERKLNVTIPAERVTGEVKRKLQEIAQKVKMPGFRPGKVPFDLIQKKYGKSAFSDVADNLIRDTYPEAIKQQKLRPIITPKIEVVDADPDKDFVYNAIFEIYPEIKLADFDKVEVEKLSANIDDSNINDMLEKMRKNSAEWQEITDKDRKSQKGDQLTIDFAIKPQDSDVEPKVEKGVEFVLGDGFMWDDFEKHLYGVGSGEEKSYTLDIPSTHMDKKLAGNKADFKVNIHKVCLPIIPELNDEFATKMGVKEGGVEELKNMVQEQLERELDQRLKELFKQNVMDKLLDLSEVEVPKALIEQELTRIAGNWNKRYAGKEEFEFPRDKFEDQARRNVALGFLMADIVAKENIKVSPEELRRKTEDTARLFCDDDRKEEIIKKMWSDKGYLRDVESNLLEEKVLEYLTSQIKTLEKLITYKEAMERK